jgi:hypothetical protein
MQERVPGDGADQSQDESLEPAAARAAPGLHHRNVFNNDPNRNIPQGRGTPAACRVSRDTDVVHDLDPINEQRKRDRTCHEPGHR